MSYNCPSLDGKQVVLRESVESVCPLYRILFEVSVTVAISYSVLKTSSPEMGLTTSLCSSGGACCRSHTNVLLTTNATSIFVISGSVIYNHVVRWGIRLATLTSV